MFTMITSTKIENYNTKRFEFVGVEDADKIRKDLWNTVNSREKVNINLLYDDDIQTIDVDGKKVIAINVPRADYTVRPVYINNNLSRGTFKRNHEGDYHCTEQELKMMLRDANEAGNDGLLLEYYTMDDIDIPTLERFRQMFQNLHPEHQWNSAEHKEFLTNFGGYTRDRRTGKEGLTMAGLLMFGKGLPVRERFDNLRMDYIDKSNLIGDQRYSDRLTYDGTWENNLGSGFPLILNAWNEKHWMKPELQEQPELMQVKLTLYIQNDVAFGSLNDPINDPINLTERQKLILQMFSEDKSLSRERLCEKTNLTDATAKREIAFLKKTGYLERIGSLKGEYWKVKRFRAIYAFRQRHLCFLSNVFLLSIKCQYDYYQIFIFNSPCCRYIT